MLPGQDYEMWVSEERHQPEPPDQDSDHNLFVIAGVLWQALKDLDDCSLSEDKEQQDSFWWLFIDTRGVDEPFSLAWCCDMLGYRPQQVRQRAEQLYPRKCWALAERFAKRAVE